MKNKEQRFVELINDILVGEYSIKITANNQLRNIEFYNSEGLWLISYDQKDGWADISWYRIWFSFEKEINMKYDETKQMMKEMLSKYLKIDIIGLYRPHKWQETNLFNFRKE